MHHHATTCRAAVALRIISALIGCILSTSVAAQTATLEDRFQETLDRFRRDYEIPGATAAYVLPDGSVGVAATGFSDLRNAIRMSPESRMLAASIGKTFVGAAVIALANEERLGLDDPISEWLDDRDWLARLPNYQSITIRHLLNHNSGLPDHVHSATFQAAAAKQWHGATNPFPPETLVTFVLDQPPLFAAGRGWSYTDTGFILLGMIIEKASGQDYYDVVRKRFIDPLNLAQTAPSDRPDLAKLATGYMSEGNPFGYPPETTTVPGVMAWHPGVEWTGGGLISTSRDLAVWGSALFSGQAMKTPYLDQLLCSVSIDSNNPGVEYGLGVAIHSGEFGPVYGHGGWIPGYSSSLRYYAGHDVSIAFQINTDIGIVDDSSQVVQELEKALAELVIGALESR